MDFGGLDNLRKSQSIDGMKEECCCDYEKRDLNEILERISRSELKKIEVSLEEKDGENKGKRSNTTENNSPPPNTTRGRPKKEVSASVNEIRLKLLQIPESSEYNSKTLYELARLYMFGNKRKGYLRENWDDSDVFDQFKTNTMKHEDTPSFLNDSLDLLATQEIKELPKSRKDVPLPPKWPSPLKNTEQDNVDIDDREDMLNNHVKHWKQVRRRWLNHSKIRYPQYSRSIQLLETVYGISQASRSKEII